MGSGGVFRRTLFQHLQSHIGIIQDNKSLSEDSDGADWTWSIMSVSSWHRFQEIFDGDYTIFLLMIQPMLPVLWTGRRKVLNIADNGLWRRPWGQWRRCFLRSKKDIEKVDGRESNKKANYGQHGCSPKLWNPVRRNRKGLECGRSIENMCLQRWLKLEAKQGNRAGKSGTPAASSSCCCIFQHNPAERDWMEGVQMRHHRDNALSYCSWSGTTASVLLSPRLAIGGREAGLQPSLLGGVRLLSLNRIVGIWNEFRLQFRWDCLYF